MAKKFAFEKEISIPLPGRTMKKPRDEGITMVIDTGLGLSEARDLSEIAGEYVDYVKVGFGTSRLIDEEVMKKKNDIYREYDIDVYPGGTLFEVALAEGVVDEFLEQAKEIGFTAIEISDGTITMSEEQRSYAIQKSKDLGFIVISEVGKKAAEEDLAGEAYARGIKKDLELGAFKVIIEARESGRRIGIYDEKGEIIEDKLKTITEGIKIKDLIFEAPHKPQQVYLIKKFGNNVNLGNIHKVDIIALEALRQGLRGDTLRTVYR